MMDTTFTDLLEKLTQSKDTNGIVTVQKNTLLRYEETNEMLRQFLELSNVTHKMLLESYTNHSKTLCSLKKDLEVTFKRIRELKTNLKLKYPDAFEATADAIKELKTRYEHEDEERFSKAREDEQTKTIFSENQPEKSLSQEKTHEKVENEQEDLISKETARTEEILQCNDSDESKSAETAETKEILQCDDSDESKSAKTAETKEILQCNDSDESKSAKTARTKGILQGNNSDESKSAEENNKPTTIKELSDKFAEQTITPVFQNEDKDVIS
ncbi:kxDL motif-containing protein CG10681-like [Hydractinia symbiolongicarpus]|uniref:kxDL motif-containing protein CG10681-like n=1 Tax=Hydractinia symbiolongicarpus TaxID=13093 RepID=UPI0025514879|nr:kxDL motif-containing protein CG10681-like [Hydractinia symbiolongicarpus]